MKDLIGSYERLREIYRLYIESAFPFRNSELAKERREWSKGGAKISGLGNNPVRKNCSLYHLSFNNPSPAKPLRNILVSDSWLGDIPFSDIFALTLKSGDTLEAGPAKKN